MIGVVTGLNLIDGPGATPKTGHAARCPTVAISPRRDDRDRAHSEPTTCSGKPARRLGPTIKAWVRAIPADPTKVGEMILTLHWDGEAEPPLPLLDIARIHAGQLQAHPDLASRRLARRQVSDLQHFCSCALPLIPGSSHQSVYVRRAFEPVWFPGAPACCCTASTLLSKSRAPDHDRQPDTLSRCPPLRHHPAPCS